MGLILINKKQKYGIEEGCSVNVCYEMGLGVLAKDKKMNLLLERQVLAPAGRHMGRIIYTNYTIRKVPKAPKYLKEHASRS